MRTEAATRVRSRGAAKDNTRAHAAAAGAARATHFPGSVSALHFWIAARSEYRSCDCEFDEVERYNEVDS